MTTTERNLLIAEAMGYKVRFSQDRLWLYEVNEVWHPDQSAEQREMIEDWLKKKPIGYSGGYNSLEKYHWFTIITRIGENIDKRDIKSESEAFLQAVAEYCLILKNE
jgi:hypothetical protein